MVEYAISMLCISLMVSPMASYSGVMTASSRSTTGPCVTLAAMPHQGASGSAETAARDSRVTGEVVVMGVGMVSLHSAKRSLQYLTHASVGCKSN